MGRLKVISLLPLVMLPVIALIISSCNLGAATPAALGTPIIATTGTGTIAVPVVRLTTQATNAGTVFNTVGQIINYSYSVTNTGIVPLNGPVMVIDDKAQVNCPNVNTVGNLNGALDPNETLICTSGYAITQEDLTRGSMTSLSTATVGGFSSGPVTTSVTFGVQAGASPTATIGFAITTPTSPSGLTRGTTITHTVIKDEWMIQLARCYGADFDAVRRANPQVIDPDVIEIGERLSIPSIGSNGTIYGPPCVGHHTVVSGDTWASIAQRYNADVVVLQAANPGGLVVGTVLKIPLNSAGSSIPVTGTTITPSMTPTPSMTFTPTITSTASMTPTPTITLTSGVSTPTSTATPTVTGTVAAQGTRITFPSGSTTANVTGVLPAQGTVRYILAGTQGQTLTITISAPAGKVALSITNPAGTKLKEADTNLTWSGVLPTTGDYTLDLVTVLATTDTAYSMDVSLTGP